jgi:hypothetical protein
MIPNFRSSTYSTPQAGTRSCSETQRKSPSIRTHIPPSDNSVDSFTDEEQIPPSDDSSTNEEQVSKILQCCTCKTRRVRSRFFYNGSTGVRHAQPRYWRVCDGCAGVAPKARSVSGVECVNDISGRDLGSSQSSSLTCADEATAGCGLPSISESSRLTMRKIVLGHTCSHYGFCGLEFTMPSPSTQESQSASSCSLPSISEASRLALRKIVLDHTGSHWGFCGLEFTIPSLASRSAFTHPYL